MHSGGVIGALYEKASASASASPPPATLSTHHQATHALVKAKHLQASFKCTSARAQDATQSRELPPSQARRLCSVSFARFPPRSQVGQEQQIWFPLRHRASRKYRMLYKLLNRSYKHAHRHCMARLECTRLRRLVAAKPGRHYQIALPSRRMPRLSQDSAVGSQASDITELRYRSWPASQGGLDL